MFGAKKNRQKTTHSAILMSKRGKERDTRHTPAPETCMATPTIYTNVQTSKRVIQRTRRSAKAKIVNVQATKRVVVTNKHLSLFNKQLSLFNAHMRVRTPSVSNTYHKGLGLTRPRYTEPTLHLKRTRWRQ